jgi:IS30 family transposase
LNALAILKIQVHRDRGKELADNRRFTLATNIEVYFCDPQSPWQRGSKFEEGPLLAQSGHSPKQMELQTTSRASWNTVNRGIDVNRCGVPMPIGELSY